MDTITFEILEDGQITTRIGGELSGANHSSGDKLLKTIEILAGGEVVREKLSKGHSHVKSDVTEKGKVGVS